MSEAIIDTHLLGRALTPEEELKLTALVDNYKAGQVRRIIVFPSADFTDPEDVPSGTVAFHAMDAPVHVDSLPDQAFEVLVGIPVGSDTDSPHLQALLARPESDVLQLLQTNVPQHATQDPPSLASISDPEGHPETGARDDSAAWRTELGSPQGFAGLFKLSRDQGRSHQYYVVVQAGVPRASAQLKDWVLEKRPTFEEMLLSDEYGHVRDLARRNALRIAYNVARALQLPIDRMEDVGSCKVHEDAALPYRTEPVRADAFEVPVSTIERRKMDNGKEYAVVYHGVQPREALRGKTIVVNAGPYHGLALFHSDGPCLEWGYPAAAGPGPSKDTSFHSSKGMTWEGGATEHPALRKDAFAPVASDAFFAAMRNMGWEQSGVHSHAFMIPVYVKLAHPDQ